MSDTKPIRLPIYLGNLSGPQGNAFAIFGSIKSCGRQMWEATDEKRWLVEADRLIAKFKTGSYEEGLDMLRQEADWIDDPEASDDW